MNKFFPGIGFLPKRFIFLDPSPGHGPAPEPEEKKTPAKEKKESTKSGAKTLGEHADLWNQDADKIANQAGDDISSVLILDRIRQVESLRKSNDSNLKNKLQEWYSKNVRYKALYLDPITDDKITGLIKEEYEQFKRKLSAEGKVEYEQIRKQKPTQTYSDSIRHLTGGASTDVVSENVQKILRSISAHGQNSATEYLKTYRKKKALELKISGMRRELMTIQAELEEQKVHDHAIDHAQKEWDKKKWSWLGPALTISAIGAGVVTGAASLGLLAHGFFTGAAMSGLWSGLSIVPSAIGAGVAKLATLAGISTFNFSGGVISSLIGGASALHFGRHPAKWAQEIGAWQTKREIKKRIKHEEHEIEHEEEKVKEVSAILQGYANQNTAAKNELDSQKKKYEEERGKVANKDDAVSKAKVRECDDAIKALKTVMNLYEVSEANKVDQMLQFEPVTEDDMVKTIKAMSADTEQEAALKALQEREDKAVREKQSTLKALPSEHGIEAEISGLNSDQETAVLNFLNDPDRTPVAQFEHDIYTQRAPRLQSAIRTIKAFPYGTEYRNRTVAVLRKMIEGERGESIRSEIEKMINEMAGPTKSAVERDPKILIRFAAAAPPVGLAGDVDVTPQPTNGQTLKNWMKTMDADNLAELFTIVQQAKKFTINSAGDQLEDQLTPIKISIEALFAPPPAPAPATDNSLIEIKKNLDKNPSGTLSEAAKTLKKVEKSFTLPDGGNFLNSVRAVKEIQLLKDIKETLEDMKAGAYVVGEKIYYAPMHEIDAKFAEIPKDKGLPGFIRNKPAVLLNIDDSLPNPTDATYFGAPLPKTLDQYKIRLKPEDKIKLIVALVGAADKIDPYVPDKDKNGLEKEVKQLQNKIKEKFENLTHINGGADAQIALNNGTIQAVKNILSQAHQLVKRSPKTFDLPDAGDGGNEFIQRVNACEVLEDLRSLHDLISTLAASYKFDNTSKLFTP